MPSTMMPIPPSHCVSERHSSNPAGWASMSVRIVAPVVVKPEVDSNSASMANIGPLKRIHGIAPINDAVTQAAATSTNASRRPSTSSPLGLNLCCNSKPATSARPAVIRKA